MRTAPFPAAVHAALGALQTAAAGMEAGAPGSRRMELRSRPCLMNARGLQRLLAPRSVALIGGAWADAVHASAASSAIAGRSGASIRRARRRDPQRYYRSVEELPASPDAAFIAAPNHDVPGIATALARRGAGGFVCFAAGFSETATEEGARLTQELVHGAGDLPFFGPNCYGFINFFDGEALWPDQLVGRRRRARRGAHLPKRHDRPEPAVQWPLASLGAVLTVGNQTRLAAEDLIELFAADERVTAFGLYLEGIQDVTRFAAATAKRAPPASRSRWSRPDAPQPRCDRAHPHRRVRWRGWRVRCVLRAGRHRPLRVPRHAMRDPQDLPHRRPPARPQAARHGRLRRRHGDDPARTRCSRTASPPTSAN